MRNELIYGKKKKSDNSLSMEPKITSLFIQSRVLMFSGPKLDQREIELFWNAQASGFVFLLFVFFLLSSFYFLSVRLLLSSHESLRKKKMMLFYSRWISFPKEFLTIQPIQQTFLGERVLFQALTGSFVSILAFNFVFSSLFSWEVDMRVFILQRKTGTLWKNQCGPKS